MSTIHPTAIVDSEARLGTGVRIGPHCLVGPNVILGDRTELISHAVVTGHTTMGSGNRVFPFACIGHEPQDLKYHGEDSEVIIGNDNTFRENVTVNAGTEGGGMVTRIGDRCLMMAYAHVAHDCILGNEVIMANCATLAGHVTVDDGVIIGGLAAIHQFLHLGKYSMIGGTAGVNKNIPPFCMVSGGYRPTLVGLNLIGLKRRGFSKGQITQLKEIYRLLLQDTGKRDERIEVAEQMAGDDAQARYMVEFIRNAKGGMTLHKRDSDA
ncbi:MAG TPA: acyl-ACP--UDP-N-acetylglucosamine O-acyltransferase [Mariprofundaceae bacterium]|nr:acyl-ACP--UDP-N-acetylglucosamine O-acyltransferase [Mariprofundaceae bacterium]